MKKFALPIALAVIAVLLAPSVSEAGCFGKVLRAPGVAVRAAGKVAGKAVRGAGKVAKRAVGR